MNKIKAPAGFQFKVSDITSYGEVRIELYNSFYRRGTKFRRGIGYILLIWEKRLGAFDTHSYLNDDFRERGLGTLMYSKAIQWCLSRGFPVCSSSSPSPLAQRVWKSKSLNKLFKIEKQSRRWFAYEK